MSHSDGIRFSVEVDSLSAVPAFAVATREEVENQRLDTSLLETTKRGTPVPFSKGGFLYALINRIKSLVQSNYVFDALYLYSPASDYLIGFEMDGLVTVGASIEQAKDTVLHLTSETWAQLIAQENITVFSEEDCLSHRM